MGKKHSKKESKKKDEPAEAPVEEQPTEQQPADDSSTTSKSKKRKTELAEIEVDLSLPEPPSKKARRLLKKGKALPAKTQTDDDSSDSEEDEQKDGAAADGSNEGKDGKKKKKKKERSPYGVWIGNLRFTVTKPDLRKWLVENSGGAITDDLITRVHMPMTKPAPGSGPSKKSPENKGFAYVDFSTYDAAVAAIALSETEWHGRRLLIKDAKNFEGRPEKKDEEPPIIGPDGSAVNGNAAVGSDKRASTKIFVGNLSFNTTEDDLHAHFEKCGKIRWVKVATFEDSGKCKGYGWVNFEEPAAAQWAVKGFVKVKETVEDVEDFMDVDEKEEDGEKKDETNGATNDSDDDDDDEDSSSDSESDSSESEKKKKEPKKEKPTKEAPRTRVRKWWVNQLLGRKLKIELAEDDQTRYNKRFRGKGKQKQQQQQQHSEEDGHGAAKKSKQDKKGDGSSSDGKKPVDINVARLTGAVVAHQGKKITFD
ncbi:hypothetical protein VTJ04DRAFT_8146 [Mycothermus thermophilus]|uniref:uncharacterized protein n=1 Tax=Humicola insolens TaxID=85995 RepID=UPI0037440199